MITQYDGGMFHISYDLSVQAGEILSDVFFWPQNVISTGTRAPHVLQLGDM